MSLMSALGAAVSGLTANGVSLRSVSNNVANAQTVGYSRVIVQHQTLVAGSSIYGVKASEAIRVVDRYLEKADVEARGDSSRANTLAQWLNTAVSFFGSPGEEGGFETAINRLQQAAINLSGTSLSTQGQGEFIGAVDDAISLLSQIAKDVTLLRTQADDSVGRAIPEINALLNEIGKLNDEIVKQTSLGRSTTGLADQRDAAVNSLAQYMSLNTRAEPDGRLLIETSGGQVLVDKYVRNLFPGGDRFGLGAASHSDIQLVRMDKAGNATAVHETLDSVGVGGSMSGFLRLRDYELPAMADQVALVIEGIMQAVNGAAADAVNAPPGMSIDGAQTGLLGSDNFGFSGDVTFAFVDAEGRVVSKATVTGNAGMTIDSFVAEVQAQIGGNGTVSFAGGQFKLESSVAGVGVAMAGGSFTDGRSVAHVLGVNQVVSTPKQLGGALPITGAMQHGAQAGETMSITLRDAAGRPKAEITFEPAATGSSFDDILAHLNAQGLDEFGSFGLNSSGGLVFNASQTGQSYTIDIIADSTFRGDTGQSLSNLMRVGLGKAGMLMQDAAVNASFVVDPTRLPLARLNVNAGVGDLGVALSDRSAMDLFAERMTMPLTGDRFSNNELDRLAGRMMSMSSGAAKDYALQAEWQSNRAAEFTQRRANFSGVNVDEELAQMIILQNSFSAAARVVSTVDEMLAEIVNLKR